MPSMLLIWTANKFALKGKKILMYEILMPCMILIQTIVGAYTALCCVYCHRGSMQINHSDWTQGLNSDRLSACKVQKKHVKVVVPIMCYKCE